jgi:predicted  nucleic acid-binding Zn-ribbon protein
MTRPPSSTSQTASGIHAGRGAAQECAAIADDLERLKTLIADAGDRLLSSFNQVGALTPELSGTDDTRLQLREAISSAVTALQFQDMATQLTAHAQRRLNALEDCLRSLSEEAALTLTVRAQPVRQAEMSSGAIDLF